MSVLSQFVLVDDTNLENLVEILEKLTKECQEQENRVNLDHSILSDLDHVMKQLSTNDADGKYLSALTECIRFLRNSVIQSKHTQDFIRENTEIIQTSANILQNHEVTTIPEGQNARESKLVAIRCCLQFMANFMVDSVENATLISLLANDTLCKVIKTVEDEKTIQYSAMGIHILIKLYPEWIMNMDLQIFPALLKHTDLEFVMLVLETVATNPIFMTQKYSELDGECRVRFLNVVISHVEIHDQISEISDEIVNQFKVKADLIFQSKLDNDVLLCWEISAMLELLGCLTTSEQKNAKLFTDSSLLASTVYLLKSVHMAGQADSSDFAPVYKLDSLRVTDNTEEMRGHPTFQFKAHLIRLIANLVHRNFNHQEMVRETEALPIILDSCRIDGRNPFITQWATLAIRNLCEGNPANQEFIGKMQKLDTDKAMKNVHYSFSEKE